MTEKRVSRRLITNTHSRETADDVGWGCRSDLSGYVALCTRGRYGAPRRLNQVLGIGLKGLFGYPPDEHTDRGRPWRARKVAGASWLKRRFDPVPAENYIRQY
jgi:hypothetical protein